MNGSLFTQAIPRSSRWCNHRIQVLRNTNGGVNTVGFETFFLWTTGALPPNNSAIFCFQLYDTSSNISVLGITDCQNTRPYALITTYGSKKWDGIHLYIEGVVKTYNTNLSGNTLASAAATSEQLYISAQNSFKNNWY